MSFIYYNPNPRGRHIGDCVIRALSKFLDSDWLTSFVDISCYAGVKGLLPQINDAWSSFLESKGYKRHNLKDTCPNCYTLKDFCFDHPKGKYFLSLDVGYIDLYTSADSGFIDGNHVVCVIDGDYYDTWDSGNEVVKCYWS